MTLRRKLPQHGVWCYLPQLIALLAGALTVTAFATLSFYPAALIGPATLFALWVHCSPRQGFFYGYSYGLGLLGFGVFWVHISIDQFGNIGLLGAIALTLIFVLLLALFYGLVGWGVGLRSSHRLLLLFWAPALWVMGEWLRGWILSGFPWLVLGYSQVETPLAGYAPILGVYGVSWLLIASAGALVLLGSVRERWLSVILLALVWGGGFLLQSIAWSIDVGTPFQVSMIQGNIPQKEKWKPQQLSPTLALYLGSTRTHWDSDLLIWPETAVPAFAHLVNERLLKPLAREAQEKQSDVLLGIPVWQTQDKRYFNGLVLLSGGRVAGQYLKRHLVPFGEFMPLDAWLRPLLAWMNIPMSSFAAGAASQPLLELAGYPAGLSICYEDAFGNEVAEALPEAAFLVNVSNDAWFGDSLAPYQHLQIARMRALETSRYLLRSTNTGISALIDHKGRLLDQSPPFVQHVLSGRVQPKSGVTPYIYLGNTAIILGLLLLLALFYLLTRNQPSPKY